MKKGFTLIELLVVVLIIGILAAVALPQYTKAVEKSRAAEAMQLLGDIATAEQIYYLSADDFTNVMGDLDLTFPGVSEGTNNIIKTNSYIVEVTVSGSGSNAQVMAEARRNGGAFNGRALRLKVKADGTVLRGFALDNDGNKLCNLVSTWSNINPKCTTLDWNA